MTEGQLQTCKKGCASNSFKMSVINQLQTLSQPLAAITVQVSACCVSSGTVTPNHNTLELRNQGKEKNQAYVTVQLQIPHKTLVQSHL